MWTVGSDEDPSTYVAWSGAYERRDDDFKGYYIPNGTAKTADDDYTSVSFAKTEPDGNATNTATTSLVTTFDGTSTDASGALTATQYLGNNGRLDIPVYGTLGVTKHFTAGEGFTLPADPVPTAEMTLTLRDSAGNALTEDDTYRALIRDADGHPVDPDTHAVVTNAEVAKFYVKDGSEFALRNGETIKITNLPDGATYQVVEQGQLGYQGTVQNNDGSTETFARGSEAMTTAAGG